MPEAYFLTVIICIVLFQSIPCSVKSARLLSEKKMQGRTVKHISLRTYQR